MGSAFYHYTVSRQVLLVAERGATTIYQAGSANGNLEQSLANEGIAGSVLIQGNTSGPWSSFKGADILMPEKTLTLESVKYYPRRIAESEWGNGC